MEFAVVVAAALVALAVQDGLRAIAASLRVGRNVTLNLDGPFNIRLVSAPAPSPERPE